MESDSSSITTKLRRSVRTYAETELSTLPDLEEVTEGSRTSDRSGARSSRDQTGTSNLARRINSKLSDFDIRGALNLLTSSAQIADHSPQNLNIISSKHPPAPDDVGSHPDPDASFGHHGDTSAVVDFLKSVGTAVGTAAGLDGLRPVVLRELTSFSAGGGGVSLVFALNRLMNALLSG